MVFKTIENPTLIKELILDRNSHHINQAQGSPFTVEPLQSLLGTDSDTPLVEALLNENTKLHHIPLTKVTKRYLESLTRNKEIIKSFQQHTIPLDEYKKGFRNWKEKTTTSPSGRHLGHHHSLLTPDGVQYSEEKEDFSERMWKLHHNITSITLLNARPLRRWLVSIVILIPKDKGKPKIYRL